MRETNIFLSFLSSLSLSLSRLNYYVSDFYQFSFEKKTWWAQKLFSPQFFFSFSLIYCNASEIISKKSNNGASPPTRPSKFEKKTEKLPARAAPAGPSSQSCPAASQNVRQYFIEIQYSSRSNLPFPYFFRGKRVRAVSRKRDLAAKLIFFY